MISHRGRSGHTHNYLKAITFDRPEWIPCRVRLMSATWIKYREELERLVLDHPRVFPGYERGSRDFDRIDDPLYELGRHTDCWGTVWNNVKRGLDSHPVEFPLEHWTAWDSYVRPDPLKDDMWGPRDWEQAKRSLEEARRQGNIAIGASLPHGFMYMRLFYLRRFENLMIDMATEDRRLWQVIQMVEAYNSVVIDKLLSLGAELMLFGDDLGLQRSLPMSPAMWRKYIKPSYERMLRPCQEAGVPVYLHTDGHILDVVADLIEVGVRVLNPQFRANGLAGLKETAKGKVALDQDLDRQLFPFATPSEIEDHIGEVVEELNLPEGGLMLYAECGPDVPLENVDAICTALETICHPPEP
jgi:uroporphyrinogen decarboxylase